MAALARVMLFLALCVGVTVSAVVDLQKRIIGGKTCERKYHVKLIGVAADGKANLCGGSLISDKWILTAAHCLITGRTMYAYLSVDPTKGLKITEAPVIYKDNGVSHDLMLLKLSASSGITPVPLPGSGDCPNVGDEVEVAGYGATEPGPDGKKKSEESPTLQCAKIKVVSCDNLMQSLEQQYNTYYNKIKNEHHFCGHTLGITTCPGDSGGGVVYNSKICGVHAFGIPESCSEPSGFKAIYNANYLSWISETIKK